MEWISEHILQIIVALAAAIAAYLNNRKKEKGGEPADYDGDGVPDNRRGAFEPSQMDIDEAERTRRIQEEIRRKIAERRGDSRPAPPLVAPRPVAQPIPEVIQRRFEEPPAPPPLPRKPASVAAQVARDEEVLERQNALAEQMRLLEVRRAEHRRQAIEAAAPLSAATAYGTGPSARAKSHELLADLRSPGGARRAWVLREVLDTPVGLK